MCVCVQYGQFCFCFAKRVELFLITRVNGGKFFLKKKKELQMGNKKLSGLYSNSVPHSAICSLMKMLGFWVTQIPHLMKWSERKPYLRLKISLAT